MHGKIALCTAAVLPILLGTSQAASSETIAGFSENALFTDANPGTAVADSTLSVLYHGQILILDLNGLAPNNSQNADRKAAMVRAAKQILSQM